MNKQIHFGGKFSAYNNDEKLVTKNNMMFELFWDYVFSRFLDGERKEELESRFVNVIGISSMPLEDGYKELFSEVKFDEEIEIKQPTCKFLLVPDDSYNRELSEPGYKASGIFRREIVKCYKQNNYQDFFNLNYEYVCNFEMDKSAFKDSYRRQNNVSYDTYSVRAYSEYMKTINFSHYSSNNLQNKFILYHDSDLFDILETNKNTEELVKIPIKAISSITTKDNYVNHKFVSNSLMAGQINGFDVTCERITLIEVKETENKEAYIIPIATVKFDEAINFKTNITSELIENIYPVYNLLITQNLSSVKFTTNLIDADNPDSVIEYTDNTISFVTGQYTDNKFISTNTWENLKALFNYNKDLTVNRSKNEISYRYNSGVIEDFKRIENNRAIIEKIPDGAGIIRVERVSNSNVSGFSRISLFSDKEISRQQVSIKSIEYEGLSRLNITFSQNYSDSSIFYPSVLNINAVVDYNDYLIIPTCTTKITYS